MLLYRKTIGCLIFLCLLMFLTFWIRIQSVERFPYGQFSENDAYLYHWQSDIIAKEGVLPAKDMHRWLPDGRDNQQLLSLYPYTIAYIHKAFPWLTLYLYHDQFNKLKKTYYLPPVGWRSLAVRLYFFGELSDIFVPIYATNEDDITDFKIWKINYPPDIKTTDRSPR